MGPDPKLLATFRNELRRSREANREAWEASTRLVGGARLPGTIRRLLDLITSSSSLDATVRDALLASLRSESVAEMSSASLATLKTITGLPARKAIRALCVHMGLVTSPTTSETREAPPAKDIEAIVRQQSNPYSLLLQVEAPSVLDLGAGDLSFAADFQERCLPGIRQRSRDFALHCVERLNPESKWGSLLHADPAHLQQLMRPTRGFEFRFWPGQDMFSLDKLKGTRRRYTIAACNAPATPTFAYEPARLSRLVIDEDLRRTKGEYTKVRVEGEPALEVMHRGRALIFPPWKFDIHGPLALLDLISRRASLAILSAVDSEVFWELLAQLLEEERVRVCDKVFTSANLPELFGHVYTQLVQLPIGKRLDLSTVAALRTDIPRTLPADSAMSASFRFRYVEVRRGAVFQDLPASRTARMFTNMSEETPPWFLALVPETS